MTETIAPLRARVRLEEPARTTDDIGGASIAYVDRGAVWAQIEAGATRLSDAYDATSTAASVTVTMRPYAGLAPGWVLIWGVRRLRVIGVRDDGAARIALDCEETRP